MEIIQLSDASSKYFKQICDWYYHWLGKVQGESYEEVVYTMQYSINNDRLPQTYVCVLDGQPVGMYQIAIFDDLTTRPDLYPWIINVYVDARYRGLGVCKTMMESVKENARKNNLQHLYLYTKHVGLYEKYGWRYLENAKTFKENEEVRLYKLDV